jgi:hypothetical protein
MRKVFMFVGLSMALTAGLAAGMLDVESRVAGWLAVGLVPVMWMVSRLLERAMGRKIWQYTAPYPYRWMR